MSYTFDWQREPRGFLSWMIVNLLTNPDDRDGSTELSNQVAKASNGFTEVTLTIQLNGVEVPTEYFVSSVQRNMEYLTEQAAKEMLGTVLEFSALRNRLGDLEAQVLDKMAEFARQLNIDLDSEDFR